MDRAGTAHSEFARHSDFIFILISILSHAAGASRMPLVDVNQKVKALGAYPVNHQQFR